MVCDPLRLAREQRSAPTVRRPKPLTPLTTAPHRVSANRKTSLPVAYIARMPLIRANANNGAVIAMIASDTNSFVVIAFFMRSVWRLNAFGSFRLNASSNVLAHYKGCATRVVCVNTSVLDKLGGLLSPWGYKVKDQILDRRTRWSIKRPNHWDFGCRRWLTR